MKTFSTNTWKLSCWHSPDQSWQQDIGSAARTKSCQDSFSAFCLERTERRFLSFCFERRTNSPLQILPLRSKQSCQAVCTVHSLTDSIALELDGYCGNWLFTLAASQFIFFQSCAGIGCSSRRQGRHWAEKSFNASFQQMEIFITLGPSQVLHLAAFEHDPRRGRRRAPLLWPPGAPDHTWNKL